MSTHVQASVAEQIEQAFPFTVDKMPLFGPDRVQTPHYGLFRSDQEPNESCIGEAVSDRYEPHTKDDVIALAEAACVGFDTVGDVSVRCGWSGNGHVVIVQPTDEYRLNVFEGTDNVFPRAIINAGYGYSFTAQFGLYRDVCQNLSMMHREARTEIRLRHTNNLRRKMDDLISDFRMLSRVSDNVFDMVRRLEAHTADVGEFIAALYPRDPEATERSENAQATKISKMLTRLLKEREATGRPTHDKKRATLWELLNSVTGYVQHDKVRRGRQDAFTRSIAAVNDSESRAAWDHAISLVG